MKALVFALLGFVALTGCESRQDAKLQEDERNFTATVKAQQDGLQWRIDQSAAKGLFWRYYSDAPPEPTHTYDVFIRCHEEPPTHEANKRVCADLQARVLKQEGQTQLLARKEKAAW